VSDGIAFVLLGAVLGAALLGGFVFMDSGGSVDADSVCEERFGDEWSGETVDTQPDDGTVKIECTDGDSTKQIGVSVGVCL